jgi:RNA polymerase sigma-70 factor (ECF subfamily)
LDDERRLVEDILAGDRGAFERLVNRYRALVVHVVYRMVLNFEDRQDICQEVFMKVYRNLAGFRFESRLSTWIARVAYNTCLNHLEKKRDILADECLPGIESLDELASAARGPDTLTEHEDISKRLEMEIESLPVTYRTILTLFHIDEMTYDEIAGIMDLPEGTVKSQLFRARKYLKSKLTSKYRMEDLLP